MSRRPYPIALGGGLDLVSPAMTVKEGRLIGCVNYEATRTGYARLRGYERFDGRARPSEQVYWILPFDTGSAAIAVGDAITGFSSGATANVLVVAVASGTWAGGDAAGTLVIRRTNSNAFSNNEQIRVAGSPKALVNGTATERSATNDADDAAWMLLAREDARAVIAAVPGQAAVLGVWAFDGFVYAIRRKSASSVSGLYRAQDIGWTEVPLMHTVAFTAATHEPEELETLTRGAVTAIIRRIVLTSGDWTGTAAGYFVVSDITGGTIAAGAATWPGGGGTVGAQAAITLPSGGNYEFVNHSFYASTSSRRMYAVNGAGKAFEFDGDVLTPITTGVADDRPTRIGVFKNHLLLGYDAGSWMVSGLGEPLAYTAGAGAVEIGVGDAPTGGVEANGAFVMFGRNRIDYLTGFDADTWDVVPVTGEAGALPRTVQKVDEPYYIDDGAMRKLSATNALGGWNMGSLSDDVDPLFAAWQAGRIEPVASVRIRNTDLVRVFYGDKSVLSAYLGGKKPAFCRLELPFQTVCACAAESLDRERVFVGANDGWVYEMDVGNDFDGAEITASLRLAWTHAGALRQNKRWHSVDIEIDAPLGATLDLAAEYDYADPLQQPSALATFEVPATGGFWNAAAWNSVVWSAQVVGVGFADLDGFGRNVSLAIRHESTNEEPHTLSVLTLSFSPRGAVYRTRVAA